MSRDATGIYSGWAEQRVACPTCAAPPGVPCSIGLPAQDDGHVEHGVHWTRTEADTEPIPTKEFDDMSYEVTVVLIKPDIVGARRVAEVLEAIESGIGDSTIVDLAMFRWTREHVERWYAHHVGRSWWEDFVAFMTSTPMVHVLVGGPDIVRNERDFLGATDPRDAEAGTLREMFGDKEGVVMRNAVHVSDSVKSVVAEWNMIRSFLGQPPIHYSVDEIAAPASPRVGFGSNLVPDTGPWNVGGERVWTPANWLLPEDLDWPRTRHQLAPWLVAALGLPDAGPATD